MEKGCVLTFSQEHEYTLIDKIGSGASCIVYGAVYKDNQQQTHNVRIKEFYPYNLVIERNENFSLCPNEKDRISFEEKKSDFIKAYNKNVQIKNTVGLTNYTVDAENIFELNNTCYIVTRCFEGATFDKIFDESLNSFFKRLYSLCKVIKKYHDMGILHLNIKPENIMIFPENTEYIMLFDFDSLISKSSLKSDEDIVFPFSNGYSAPELSYEKKDNISEKTDIYSIGAIVFYKLFGKYADSFARKIGAEYDFENMRFFDKRFQPSFFRTLETFFQKTLSAYLPHRYNSVDELFPVLSELIRLSDLESTFVYDNFVYNSACFVGRNNELNEIEHLLKNNQSVFLSGIGGIGKTETARMFIHRNRSEFNTVVFVSYKDSVVNSICGSDIKINNFEIIKDESEEDLFNRKLDLLKALLTKNDIIILDNFDNESDKNIKELFSLPCKFIVTTRVNFMDYNYQQIVIDKIKDINKLTELFFYYNRGEYYNKDLEDIHQFPSF